MTELEKLVDHPEPDAEFTRGQRIASAVACTAVGSLAFVHGIKRSDESSAGIVEQLTLGATLAVGGASYLVHEIGVTASQLWRSFTSKEEL